MTQPLHEAVRFEQFHCIKILLEHGSNINADSYFGSPLCIAIKQKNIALTQYLLEQGANVNLCNAEGRTSLHLAAEIGSKKLAQLLIKHHAQDTADNENIKPSAIARENDGIYLGKKKTA